MKRKKRRDRIHVSRLPAFILPLGAKVVYVMLFKKGRRTKSQGPASVKESGRKTPRMKQARTEEFGGESSGSASKKGKALKQSVTPQAQQYKRVIAMDSSGECSVYRVIG